MPAAPQRCDGLTFYGVVIFLRGAPSINHTATAEGACVGGKTEKRARGSFNYQQCQVRISENVRGRKVISRNYRAENCARSARGNLAKCESASTRPPTHPHTHTPATALDPPVICLAWRRRQPGRALEIDRTRATICGYNQSLATWAPPVRADLVVCVSKAISRRGPMKNESLVLYICDCDERIGVR